jgi:hypothetical protein
MGDSIHAPLFGGGMSCNAGQGGLHTGQGDSDSSPSSTHPSEGTLHSSPPFEGGTQGGCLDWNTLSREEQQTLKKQMLEDNEKPQGAESNKDDETDEG